MEFSPFALNPLMYQAVLHLCPVLTLARVWWVCDDVIVCFTANTTEFHFECSVCFLTFINTKVLVRAGSSHVTSRRHHHFAVCMLIEWGYYFLFPWALFFSCVGDSEPAVPTPRVKEHQSCCTLLAPSAMRVWEWWSSVVQDVSHTLALFQFGGSLYFWQTIIIRGFQSRLFALAHSGMPTAWFIK